MRLPWFSLCPGMRSKRSARTGRRLSVIAAHCQAPFSIDIMTVEYEAGFARKRGSYPQPKDLVPLFPCTILRGSRQIWKAYADSGSLEPSGFCLGRRPSPNVNEDSGADYPRSTACLPADLKSRRVGTKMCNEMTNNLETFLCSGNLRSKAKISLSQGTRFTSSVTRPRQVS